MRKRSTSWGLRICRYCQHGSPHCKQWPGLCCCVLQLIAVLGAGCDQYVGWYQLRTAVSPASGRNQECSYTMNALSESKSKLYLWQLLEMLQCKDLATEQKFVFHFFNSDPCGNIPWLVVKLSLCSLSPCVADGVCIPGCPQKRTER